LLSWCLSLRFVGRFSMSRYSTTILKTTLEVKRVLDFRLFVRCGQISVFTGKTVWTITRKNVCILYLYILQLR
jgi:hypothetical protein